MTLIKNCWPRALFSCYSTLRRWVYAKCRPGLKSFNKHYSYNFEGNVLHE